MVSDEKKVETILLITVLLVEDRRGQVVDRRETIGDCCHCSLALLKALALLTEAGMRVHCVPIRNHSLEQVYSR